MSSTLQRDEACELAKTNPGKALERAMQISDPWFRAQALSWVARFTDGDTMEIAQEVAKAASECEDAYQRSAVKAWEVVALAERFFKTQAQEALHLGIELAGTVQPLSSRSDALFLLLQAAISISQEEAKTVFDQISSSCPAEEHWRCKRNLRDAEQMLAGKMAARPFFW